VPDNVIAIDGPAGSGKSTTAREVARCLDFAHLDSGALYRAITLVALEVGSDLDDVRLVRLATESPVALGLADGQFFPTIRANDVSDFIRSAPVTARVSRVAALPGVRTWATGALRQAARRHPRGVVCDGRDIGTVVFPNAKLKIFLTASVSERVRRRALELDGQIRAERVAQLTHEIVERDVADSNRDIAPLAKAADAIEHDTSDLSFEDQVNRIVELARNAFGSGATK